MSDALDEIAGEWRSRGYWVEPKPRTLARARLVARRAEIEIAIVAAGRRERGNPDPVRLLDLADDVALLDWYAAAPGREICWVIRPRRQPPKRAAIMLVLLGAAIGWSLRVGLRFLKHLPRCILR